MGIPLVIYRFDFKAAVKLDQNKIYFVFFITEGATFKKCFRRVVKRNSLISEDFSSYVDESLSRCEFVGQKEVSPVENKERIRQSLLNK